MRPLDINELPAWSPWPARLLGVDRFARPQRDLAKIEQEYNCEKFAACLARYEESGGALDPVALRFSIGGRPLDEERDAVWRGDLVVARQQEMIDGLFATLDEVMVALAAESRTIVELGCAFGTNLWHLARRFPGLAYVGGDYSDNAITLAAKLYRDRGDIRVGKLNFYDEAYPVLDAVEGPATIFTSQALEQLPATAPFLDALARYRDKIAAVVHLEPAYDLHDDSLIGLMRRRYLELNDYNRDLVAELRRRPDVRIVELRRDVMGFHAFNPLTLVVWRFR
jgi:SAM-dependent methyltransferase